MNAPLLKVEQLETVLDTDSGLVRAVDALSLAIDRGETFALVGESGCGKSMTALSILRLLPENGRVAAGRIDLAGVDVAQLPEARMRDVRGRRIGIIFQEPATSLNPVVPVGAQIAEVIERHTPLRGAEARARTLDWLRRVGLPEPERRIDNYPFQLSGGQKQRVMIAIALAAEPDVVIADEPTTALDVTVQKQILDLLLELQREQGMAMLLITHDLGIVSRVAHRIALMYAGQVVEVAETAEFFARPLHPYAQMLLDALPDTTKRGRPLAAITGTVPRLDEPFARCRFSDRCPAVHGACVAGPPPLYAPVPAHSVRCVLYKDGPVRVTLDLSAADAPAPASRSCAPAPDASESLLEVRDFRVYFPIRHGLLKRTIGHVKAVDGVSFSLRPGRTLALVGESGCGKTTTGKALLQLLREVAVVSGEAWLEGRAMAELHGDALHAARRTMQIIFQDPFASLDPRMRVSEILAEGLLSLRPEVSARRTSGPHSDAAGQGRAPGGLDRPLSPRVLRGAAPAARHRPRARGRATPDRLRRADVGAGRFGPGPDPQPAQAAAGRTRRGVPVHYAQFRSGRVHGARHRGHEGRPHRRSRSGRTHPVGARGPLHAEPAGSGSQDSVAPRNPRLPADRARAKPGDATSVAADLLHSWIGAPHSASERQMTSDLGRALMSKNCNTLGRTVSQRLPMQGAVSRISALVRSSRLTLKRASYCRLGPTSTIWLGSRKNPLGGVLMKLRISPIARSVALAFGGMAVALPASQVLAQQQQQLERVEITGSRIKRIEAETAAPVQVLTRDDIERTGKQSVQEVLRSITADSTGSIPSSFSNGFASGSAAVSLRGLGVNSTLVLVNGRRMSTYGLADDGTRTFVDLNSLPLDAIERIEVLKDGASAIYGADAVGGVVNVILRKNYAGAALGASYGQTGDSDGKQMRITGSYGIGNIDTDKYNAFVSLEWQSTDNIWSKDRGFIGQGDLRSLGYYNVLNGANRPYFGLGPSSNSRYGVIRDPVTNARVNVIPCDASQKDPATGLCLYNRLDEQEIQPELDRLNIFGRFAYQLAPTMQAYTELGYFQTKMKANGTLGANNDGGVYQPGDPFNPLVVHGPMAFPATHPDNPFGVARTLFYVPYELGGRDQETDNRVFRGLVGLQGSHFGWDWDTGLLYTESKLKNTNLGFIVYDTMQAALNNGTYRVNSPNTTDPSVLAAVSPRLETEPKSSVTSIDFKASRELMKLDGGSLGAGARRRVPQGKGEQSRPSPVQKPLRSSASAIRPST